MFTKELLKSANKKNIKILDRRIDSEHKHRRSWIRCLKCNHECIMWHKVILNPGSSSCRKCSNSQIKGSAKSHRAWLRANKPTLRLIGEYKAFDAHALHKCIICTNEFMMKPSVIEKSKGPGCRICSRRKLQAQRNEQHRQEYIEILKGKGCTMLPVVPYEKALTPILHRCTKCEYERTVTPDYMKRLAKCTSCSPKNLSRTVETKHKSFVVFGYEERCLELMRKHYRYSEIEAFNSGKVPIVHYGRGQRYMPDFYVKKDNMLVEAKGLATFGMRKFPLSKDSGADRYYQCCAKAKAALAAGYRYAFCLIENNERIKLPKGWYDLSFREMKTYLKDNGHM